MDNEVSAGNTASISTLGHVALGLTLLAIGLGQTGVLDGVGAGDAVTLAKYVGGGALFLLGLLEFRGGNGFNGTAFAGIGAFFYTWAAGSGGNASADAAGLFMVLFALLALTLAMGASSGLFGQGMYALLCLSLLLTGIGSFADTGGLVKAGGWVAAVTGLLAWYGATAALAHWPMAFGKVRGGAVAA
ncbi:GPR1/FUN34/YaaH family transporter [Streptomyces bambusae]|uniref:GPR1/FUN34/YaaH family transporter n=1 Tax=Streptomyces bambusae TaxID=1550616 RepID=UPI001CFDBEE4|nr:GPR1/FUN34/YaaH family transporter [Streptomyces bambusae]MCB5167865.1 GPR1/FUN34/YaaH family transporter [Streptomyces bambusae]